MSEARAEGQTQISVFVRDGVDRWIWSRGFEAAWRTDVSKRWAKRLFSSDYENTQEEEKSRSIEWGGWPERKSSTGPEF